MPYSSPNQKWIRVHKPRSNNFLMIDNHEWMTANKTLSPYGLQLYLFLAANADGYQFALSPKYAREAAGITRTTFYEYLRRLEIKGYLVWRHGNTYDFYTSPRPENERTHPDRHANAINFEAESSPCESSAAKQTAPQTSSPACDTVCSPCQQKCPQDNKGINNRYTDKTQTPSTEHAGKPRTPASPAAVAAVSPEQEEKIITIPPPVSKPKRFIF